jgi:type IV pilus assembly protein PilY1
MTSKTPSNWGVSTYGNGSPTPLFTTPPIQTTYTTTTTTSGSTSSTTTSSPTITVLSPVAASSQSTYAYGTTSTSTTSGHTTTTSYTVISPQPITTQLVVVSTTEPSASTNVPYIMVEFGTGSVVPQSVTSSASYADGPQTLYGIWDWNMGTAGTPGSGYAGLMTGAPTATAPITQSTLQPQTVTSSTVATGSSSILGYRTVSENVVCLVGMTCGTVNSSGQTVSAAGTDFGWYLTLPGYNGVPWVGGSNQTEQIIYNPIESEGAFIVNTTIPANNSPLTCSVVTASGWTMALDPATGGGFTNKSFFDDTTGNVVSGSISGIALNAVGSPSVVTANGKPYLVNQTVNSVPTVNQINPPGPSVGARLTWLQLH